jgi:carbamoyltransferase
MTKPIYILGTGLSHNGSAVLLKDGRVCVGIEKERISRRKHDGGNDTLAIQYCLDAEGIELKDVALVVQCANFDIPDRNQFNGKRIFANSETPKIVDISHHLAHAYSAVGTSPFSECAVMVIDGCGSPLHQFIELHPSQKSFIDPIFLEESQMLCEKDSFYHFDGQKLSPLLKDFSKMAEHKTSSFSLPTTQHSIGGFYATISKYVFGDMDDVGKLMGLAPFGETGIYNFEAFEFKSGSLYLNETWQNNFINPSSGYDYFKENFGYYANVAKWAQEQVEKAVMKCISTRIEVFPHNNLCYTGGVALNAVANAKLQDLKIVDDIYFEPAAGDNGLALGCAFYGWLEYLNMPKVAHDGSTCFGKKYNEKEIEQQLDNDVYEAYSKKKFSNEEELLKYCADKLNKGKTIAWFQSESEFGPRSLGRRSILAHPGIENLKDHINRNIKFREDFRPFAPAVLKDKVNEYFENGRNSPYMILVDKTRTEYLDKLKNVTHRDGSARVQTVDEKWNNRFHKLLKEFYKVSGIAVLLNTSLNRKGMPMVETPKEALQLFGETALDILVLENFVLEKK